MNSILKNRTGINDIAAQPPTYATIRSPVVSIGKYVDERETILLRIAQFGEELERRAAEVDALHDDVRRAREEGVAQGYQAGLAAAQELHSEHLSHLEKAMIRAGDHLREDLGSLKRLAALLAQECLDIILLSDDGRAKLVEKIIEGQVAKISRAMLVNICVSQLDFPDDEVLRLLAERLRLDSVKIYARDDLDPGACTIALQLGEMRIGIDQQWPVLRQLLSEIASPEGET